MTGPKLGESSTPLPSFPSHVTVAVCPEPVYERSTACVLLRMVTVQLADKANVGVIVGYALNDGLNARFCTVRALTYSGVEGLAVSQGSKVTYHETDSPEPWPTVDGPSAAPQ